MRGRTVRRPRRAPTRRAGPERPHVEPHGSLELPTQSCVQIYYPPCYSQRLTREDRRTVMTRLKVFGLMLALVAAAPAAAFAQGSVAGDWDLTLTTPQGTNTVSVSFKQVGDGDRVTGTLTSPMGSVPLAGTATAGELNLTASIDVQGMVLDMA